MSGLLNSRVILWHLCPPCSLLLLGEDAKSLSLCFESPFTFLLNPGAFKHIFPFEAFWSPGCWQQAHWVPFANAGQCPLRIRDLRGVCGYSRARAWSARPPHNTKLETCLLWASRNSFSLCWGIGFGLGDSCIPIFTPTPQKTIC